MYHLFLDDLYPANEQKAFYTQTMNRIEIYQKKIVARLEDIFTSIDSKTGEAINEKQAMKLTNEAIKNTRSKKKRSRK